MSFLWKARASAEVRAAVDMLQTVASKFSDCNQSLLQQLVDTSRELLTSSREEMEFFTSKIRNEGESIEQWAYTCIINLAADEMESGRHHVYRGALGFAGEDYRKIFERAIDAMVSLKAYTKEWADTNIRDPVYKNVRRMG